MAAKLTLLRSSAETFSNTTKQVLYWYTISPVVQDSLGNTIIVQAASTLDRFPDVLRYLTAGDRTALDAGQAGYELLNRMQTAGETNVAFRNRLLAEHSLREAAWITERRAEHAAAGTTAN